MMERIQPPLPPAPVLCECVRSYRCMCVILLFSKFIRLYLSGFTSGERNGTIGPDVGFNNEFDEGNDAIVWPPDT